ncbi:class I SAM-dependent methyltransferase [Lentilitoribacter sp. Alg239-R112]|jgi:ubiquinone/menaquinone biosynthesis C-methylase UbiE|uniref:class I SAM-dependent methyltransferase n=1 Tax=Lentilitoribacter sp. Alg239-R112 TaxID=2305987 RepID=UPI0013A708FB|nr:class I SAM-dependent methyltransferase [Lentilitoribacter sp. Alg239-R112]
MISDLNFGLPLEYQLMPDWFDAHNIKADTEDKNASLLETLSAYDVKSVLDMTCGTGSQVFHLSKHDFDVIGSDFSPELLKIAREKSKALGKNLSFIDGDMRDIQVGRFDAVITMFNAIGHVSKHDFLKTIGNVRNNLKPGGFYVFDIFNLEAMSDDAIKSLEVVQEKEVGSARFHQHQISQIDHERGLMISTDHYDIHWHDGRREQCQNTFMLQIYTADELKDLLQQSGFAVVKQTELDGSELIDDKSLEILTVAKKLS